MARNVEDFLARLDREADQFVRQVEKFAEARSKDPIAALGYRFIEGEGLRATKAPTFRTDWFSVEVEAPTIDIAEAEYFEPSSYKYASTEVTPISLVFGQEAILLALKVEHAAQSFLIDQGRRLKLDWVNPRNPQSSRIYLIDDDNSEYYYPISTDLSGELVPGRPRVGLVAFEPARVPADNFSLHFSDVKLSSTQGDWQTFSFRYAEEGVAGFIERALSHPTFVEQMKADVEAKKAELIEQATKSKGCVGVLVSIAAVMTVAALVLI